MPGVKLKANTYELQESNVRLKLTCVDSVGFGDQINKDDSFKPIVEYIDQQFENYLQVCEMFYNHQGLRFIFVGRIKNHSISL